MYPQKSALQKARKKTMGRGGSEGLSTPRCLLKNESVKNHLKRKQHKLTEMEPLANAPARLTSAQLEEVDYGELYRADSPKGRKSKADPRAPFKIMALILFKHMPIHLEIFPR